MLKCRTISPLISLRRPLGWLARQKKNLRQNPRMSLRHLSSQEMKDALEAKAAERAKLSQTVNQTRKEELQATNGRAQLDKKVYQLKDEVWIQTRRLPETHPDIQALQQAYHAARQEQTTYVEEVLEPAKQRRRAAKAAYVQSFREVRQMFFAEAPAAFKVNQRIRFGPHEAGYKMRIEQGLDFFRNIMGPGRIDHLSVDVKRSTTLRACFHEEENAIKVHPDEPVKAVAHELGHWLEAHDPDLVQLAADFWTRRTGGERF